MQIDVQLARVYSTDTSIGKGSKVFIVQDNGYSNGIVHSISLEFTLIQLENNKYILKRNKEIIFLGQ